MNWKTRQLFSDREHGIVSGLSPVNMAGGGTVPYPSSYQDGTSPEEAEYLDAMQAGAMMGGTASPLAEYINAGRAAGRAGGTEAAQEAPPELSIEQRVAALAAQQGISVPAARAMILNQMLEQQGVTLSEEVINQFATGLITLHEALSQAVGGGVGRAVGPGMGGGVGRAIGEAIQGMQGGGTVPTSMPFQEAYNLMQALAKDPTMSVSDADKAQMERAFFLGGEDHTFFRLVKGMNYQPSSQFKNIVKESVPKMQAGTGPGEAMAIDLFQQGDEEINEPLNMMVQSTNPSIADITPTETVEETVTVTEDQGPSTMDGSLQKLPFQQMAIKIVEQADEILKQEDYMNIEEVEQQVQQELTAIDEQYRLQTGATDSILTEEFLTLLDRITTNTQDEFDTAPGMAEGGISGDEEDMEAYIRSLGGGASADPDEVKRIIKRYLGSASSSSDLQAKKQALARRSALLGGKTKQGGWAGMMDILGQADAAEAAALGDLPRQLSANEAALERLAMETETSLYGGTKGTGTTAEGKNLLILKKIMAMPEGPEKEAYLDRLNVDTESKTILNYAEKFARDLYKLKPNELKQWKKANNFDNNKSIAEMAVQQATDLINAIKGGSSTSDKADSNVLD